MVGGGALKEKDKERCLVRLRSGKKEGEGTGSISPGSQSRKKKKYDEKKKKNGGVKMTKKDRRGSNKIVEKGN